MRYALRTLPSHPSRLAGDIIPLRGITDPVQAERIRESFTTGDHLEVVALDDDGKVAG